MGTGVPNDSDSTPCSPTLLLEVVTLAVPRSAPAPMVRKTSEVISLIVKWSLSRVNSWKVEEVRVERGVLRLESMNLRGVKGEVVIPWKAFVSWIYVSPDELDLREQEIRPSLRPERPRH